MSAGRLAACAIATIAVVACRGTSGGRAAAPSPGASAEPVAAVCIDLTSDTSTLPVPLARFIVLYDSLPAPYTPASGMGRRAEWWASPDAARPVVLGAWSGQPLGGDIQPTYAEFRRADSVRVIMGLNLVGDTVVSGVVVWSRGGGTVRSDRVLRGRRASCRRVPASPAPALPLDSARSP